MNRIPGVCTTHRAKWQDPGWTKTKRIEFLFELYDKYTGGMFGEEKKGRKKKK